MSGVKQIQSKNRQKISKSGWRIALEDVSCTAVRVNDPAFTAARTTANSQSRDYVLLEDFTGWRRASAFALQSAVARTPAGNSG
jgi:hypothetical protein